MTFFSIFREQDPNILKYHFGEYIPNDENPPGENQNGIPAPVSNDQLNEIFDGDDVVEDNVSPNLKFLQDIALEMAHDTYTESDCSLDQLQTNLISLIGQKSVEMNMLSHFVSMTCGELQDYYNTIFNDHDGRIQLERIDIVEASEIVRRSRKIVWALNEVNEFEKNFQKLNPKIPKSYFVKAGVMISSLKKGMIFAVNYIDGKTAPAKSVKQSLKKNASFSAFAVDVNVVLTEITNLGILGEVRRVKRKRVVIPRGRGVNEVNIVERPVKYYTIRFDENDESHKNFLQLYQIIYPGSLFGA